MPQERLTTEHYIRRADRYFRNTDDFLKRGEADKAGECLWGAVALSIKAVALKISGKRLRSHQGLRAFAEELAKSLRDPTIISYFDSAEILHRNFYEADHTLEDIKARRDGLRPFLLKLFKMAGKPSRQEKL